MQNFSFLGWLVFIEKTFSGRPADRPAGRPKLMLMLNSAQLELAEAWAELGNNPHQNIAEESILEVLNLTHRLIP